jgi:murein DD-endopeptidase MepM/ murein hydrolase activator NlpD
MKVMLNRYRSKLFLSYYKKYYLVKKRLSKVHDAFLEWGHEKMTVMLIPHNERKIFNFQISKLTVSFFFLLFLIVLATSSYALIQQTAVKREEQRLLTTYEATRSDLLQYKNLTDSVAQLMEEMKPDVDEIYEITAGTDQIDGIWNTEDTNRKDAGEIANLSRILPDEIYTIKNLQNEIIRTTDILKTVKNFVDARGKVAEDTPSMVPNPGFITSLFGWRRSPFGYGRDFHPGIDIAASTGTPIRATAPGTVINAGWSGGYGLMIRIRHKYGFDSIYGHCSKIRVSVGQKIKRGEVIGLVGQTGDATGSHCHYEIRLGDISINPYPYMGRLW